MSQTETASDLPPDPSLNQDYYTRYVGTGVAHKPPPNLHVKKYNLTENKSTSILHVDSPAMSQEMIEIEPKSVDVFSGEPVSEIQKEDEIVEDSQFVTNGIYNWRIEGEEEGSLEIIESQASLATTTEKMEIQESTKREDPANDQDSVAIQIVNQMTSPFSSPSPKIAKIEKSDKTKRLSSERLKRSPKLVKKYQDMPDLKPMTPIKKSPQISANFAQPKVENLNLHISKELEAVLDECEQRITCFDPQLKNENENNFVMTKIDGVNQTTPTRQTNYTVRQKWFCQNECDEDGPKICIDYKRLFNCYKSQFENGYFAFETLIYDLAETDLNKRKPLSSLHSYFQMKSGRGEGYETLQLFLFIVKLAESAEDVLPEEIPFLCAKTNGSVTLSQHQCAVILANMFLGISCEDELTFITMLSSSKLLDFEKIKFIMHYFSTIKQSMPQGNVSFRRVIANPPEALNNPAKISNLDFHVSVNLRIEEVVGGSQMDFANRYIGGGVLGKGAVQEEIRFLMCPEMIVSMLLNDVMEPTDAIFIVGAQTYSSYDGYSSTLRWSELRTADANSNKYIDEYGRCANELIAIDAVNYGYYRPYRQFDSDFLHREIKKLLVGFSAPSSCTGHDALSPPPPISTGWWGCGAFGGDKQLKAMLQVVAATIAGRSLIFCTFNDEHSAASLYRLVARMKKLQLTAGGLFSLLLNYRNWNEFNKSSLFDYISFRMNIRQSRNISA